MKLKGILRKLQDESIMIERMPQENITERARAWKSEKEQAISQIREELEELVKESHGWAGFKKNLDKFCEEE